MPDTLFPSPPLQSHAAPLHIAAVTLRARDLESLSAFYETSIGLDRISGDSTDVLLGSGGVGYLRLVQADGRVADDPRSAGLFHTAFLLPSREALGAWFIAAYQQRGIGFDGASDHGVSEAFYLSDPEGNGIEVYADRPRDGWQRTSQGYALKTEPLDIEDVANAGRMLGGSGRFPDDARIGHVHLRVGDIATAEPFYLGTLGLDATARMPQATFMSSGGYHHHLAVNTWRSRGAGVRPEGIAGLAQVTLASRDAATTARLAGRTHVDPWGITFDVVGA
jgi:catechol 2,3-dioxygenase